MHSRPREPGEKAAHADLAALQDGETFTYDGHVALVEVAKGFRRADAGYTPGNHMTRIAALLYCNLRHAGQRFAILIERSSVADNEYLGVPGHGQVAFNANASGAIGADIQPFAGR